MGAGSRAGLTRAAVGRESETCTPDAETPTTPRMAPTYILGISAFYHDSAAALLRDGEIVAAAQE